jgi:hypothetical protein
MNTFNTGTISIPKISFEFLQFKERPFQDEKTIEYWKRNGHIYEKYSGSTIEKNQGHPNWVNQIEEKFNLKNKTSCVYCMTPGTIMPEHRDFYKKYKSLYNLSNANDIVRIVIFLEDWKSGHYFEIDDNPIVNWKHGDYIMWKNDTPHMAANIGRENRYTLQITGIDV